MVKRTRQLAVLAGLATLGACSALDRGPSDTGPGVLEIVVTPDPLRILWACPSGQDYCQGSLDSTITVNETTGVGVRLDRVDIVARESITSTTVGEVHLGAAEIASLTGNNRVPPRGSLAVRPLVQGWPYPAALPKPTLNVDVTVEGTDDGGNAVRQSKRVTVR